jgi:Flp pilus assembly protein TadG
MTLGARLHRWFSGRCNLIADQRGMSAVEFALILPVMVLIYLGGFELTQALSIKRQVSLTASTVTNVVSQYTTISASQQMPDILGARRFPAALPERSARQSRFRPLSTRPAVFWFSAKRLTPTRH